MTINDDNWKFLHDATGLSLTFNDMYYRYLRDLGYTGTLQDMIAKSGLGINPSQGGGVTNNFSPAKSKINAGASDVTFLFIGDSTGNASDEWIYKFALGLASRYPTHTIRYALWDEMGAVYPTPSTLQTGSGPRTIWIWNASVVGTNTVYFLDGARYTNAIGAITPDVVVWNHGHNISDVEALRRGKFLSGFEALKQRKPLANTLIVSQNPNRDNNSNDLNAALATEYCNLYGDTLIDFRSQFLATGKNPIYYADAIHPNVLGQDTLMVPTALAVWDAASAGAKTPSAAFLNTGAVNLLNLDASGVDQGYGYFKNYVSGLPTG